MHTLRFSKKISLEAGGNIINVNLKDPFKLCHGSSKEASMVVSLNLQFCGKNESNVSGEKNIDYEHGHVRHKMDRTTDNR